MKEETKERGVKGKGTVKGDEQGGVSETRPMKVFMGKKKGLAALDDSSTFDEKPARLCRHLGCW